MTIKGKKIGRKVRLHTGKVGKIVAVVKAGEEIPMRFSRMRSGGHRNVDDRLVHWLRDHESYIVEVIQANGLPKYYHPPVKKLTAL